MDGDKINHKGSSWNPEESVFFLILALPCVGSKGPIQISDNKWKMNSGKPERQKVLGTKTRRELIAPVHSVPAGKE